MSGTRLCHRRHLQAAYARGPAVAATPANGRSARDSGRVAGGAQQPVPGGPLAGLAILIGILCRIPLRIHNLCSICIGKDLKFVGDTDNSLLLTFAEHATKNGMELEFSVGPRLRDLIRIYIDRFLPFFAGQSLDFLTMNWLLPSGEGRSGHLTTRTARSSPGRSTSVSARLSTRTCSAPSQSSSAWSGPGGARTMPATAGGQEPQCRIAPLRCHGREGSSPATECAGRRRNGVAPGMLPTLLSSVPELGGSSRDAHYRDRIAVPRLWLPLDRGPSALACAWQAVRVQPVSPFRRMARVLHPATCDSYAAGLAGYLAYLVYTGTSMHSP